jgi:tetratricopeptide (TPR) repeat protein
LADAIEPMRASAEAAVTAKDWVNAATGYNNLSEIHLTLGNVLEAVAAAGHSVDLADRSGEWTQSMRRRTTLADALHQSGDLAEAKRLFEEAERLQAEGQPEYPILYSVQGCQYCNLLLGQGEATEVLSRASQTLPWGERYGSLLSVGLEHLSLGRAHPSGSVEAVDHLDQAVEFLRRAGTLHHLPLALLARGTPRDLDEAFRIATRSGMRLHLADYHFIMARNALAANDRPSAREHFEKAEALVQATGYHRRDSDLATLRAEL